MKTPDFHCPASQTLCETWTNNGVPYQHVTANRDKSKYTLWRNNGEKWEAVKTASTPTMLKEE